MLASEIIGGYTCYFDCQEGAEALLIQAIAQYDLEGLEQQIAQTRALTGWAFSIIAFHVTRWNDALSPWPAPPVFGKEGFAGKARETLDFIESALLPWARERFSAARLYLGGYSLSGLFALWAACQTDAFEGVAACSPSVWFPGWIEYAQAYPPKAASVYLSLGDREEKTRNQTMARVGDCIRQQHALLQNALDCTLEWNPGNHFMDAPLRVAKGFAWLLNRPRIRLVTDSKRQYMDLLLLGDEQEDMIGRYLDRGDLYVLDDHGVKALCVVMPAGDALEIKNIAVHPACQRRGFGRLLINHVARQYAGRFSVLRAGTGDSPLTIPFYEACGFSRTGVIPDFFTRNYDHPIVEGGVRLRDMIVLERRM